MIIKTDDKYYKEIAKAIGRKKKENKSYFPAQMAKEIDNIKVIKPITGIFSNYSALIDIGDLSLDSSILIYTNQYIADKLCEVSGHPLSEILKTPVDAVKNSPIVLIVRKKEGGVSLQESDYPLLNDIKPIATFKDFSFYTFIWQL